MSECLHQRIAGVDYLVTYPPAVTVRAASPAEIGFVWPHPVGREAIRVNVALGEAPDLNSWRTLVSEGPAWTLLQGGAQRCLCAGQRFAGWPARVVATWAEDARQATVHIAAELLAWPHDGAERGNPAGYPVNQLLLIYFLAPRQGLLVHAAGLASDGRGLVFPGVSGAGKSTLAREFLARSWPTLLSDDRVVVRHLDGGFQAFGTPWPGDAGVAVNASAPLAAILFPARGPETRISKLTPQAALDRLLPTTSILWHEQELLSRQLETCESLLREVPAFELCWSPEAGVVDDVRAFLRRL